MPIRDAVEGAMGILTELFAVSFSHSFFFSDQTMTAAAHIPRSGVVLLLCLAGDCCTSLVRGFRWTKQVCIISQEAIANTVHL